MERGLAEEDSPVRGSTLSADEEQPVLDDADKRPAQRRRFNNRLLAAAGRGPKIKKILVFKGKGI